MRFWLVRRKVCVAVGLGLALILVLIFGASYRLGSALPPGETPEATSRAVGDRDSPGDAAPAPETVDAVAGAGEPYADDYYVECRLERERSRGKQVELLRSIVGDPNAGPEARQNAQARLLQISLELDREVSVENILRAKGLPEVVVFFQNETVTVVVPHSITPEQGTTVVNLTARATGAPPENILVIARDH